VKYGITGYTINDDFSVDVRGDVELSFKGFTRLPLKFGNQLTSLIGGPSEVGWDFICFSNRLTDLEGCPSSVGGSFDCCYNELTSLEGCPDNVGDEFYCDEPFKTLIELFHSYNDFKNSIKEYGWLDGNQIIKIRFQDTIEDENYVEPGMIIPDKIEGFEYI
jgi:hypothetical protein